MSGKYIKIFCVSCAVLLFLVGVLLFIPAFQTAVFSCAERIIGKEIRNPEKWGSVLKKIAALPMLFSVPFFVLSVRRWSCFQREKLVFAYIYFFFCIVFTICLTGGGNHKGEWDDYTIPTVSLTSKNPHLCVYPSDIERAAELYPAWGDDIRTRASFSPYTTKDGGAIAWYFPTYAAFCLPLSLLFPSSVRHYSFAFTNMCLLMAMIFVVAQKMKHLSFENLFLIVLLLTLNPIVFYIVWPSAEVFLYSMLGLSVLFWFSREWKKSAFFVSLAGSVNPVILIVGLAIICDYFSTMLRGRNGERITHVLFVNMRETALFGCCFLYSLLPFVYDGVATGKSIFILVSGNRHNTLLGMIPHFFAYLFDLNFGILPYYTFVLLFAIAFFVVSIWRKQFEYTFRLSVFFLLVAGYCRLLHIDCGMSGMARYNTWACVILIFSFVLYVEKYAELPIVRFGRKGAVIALVVSLCIIARYYHPKKKFDGSGTGFTPIARFVLDNAPCLYNPLHSTFRARVFHDVNGGSALQDTPVIYADESGNIRKLLVAKKDIAFLRTLECEYVQNRLEKLTDKESYISIPRRYCIPLERQEW